MPPIPAFAWRDKLYAQIQSQLYHPDTGLIYDYVTSREPERRFAHLPGPGEAARGFPNLCGWGTGMEDCALNAGLMLAWAAASGRADSPFVQSLAVGLSRCAAAHGRRGFVARGLTPENGRGCYPNSSRDQFTLAVYGMWRWLKAGPVADSMRELAQNFLRDVADYCAQTVTAANGFSLLRLDGGAAAGSKMWDCAPHEMLRLPLIYGAAWDATGEERFRRLLHGCVEEGMRRTLEATPASHPWWDMPLVQMQCSLDFFAASGVAPEIAGEVARALNLAGGFAASGMPRLLDEMAGWQGPWDELYDDWRRLHIRCQKVRLEGPVGLTGETGYVDRPFGVVYSGFYPAAGVTGESIFLNPIFRAAYAEPNRMLRAAGNLLATMAMAPDLPEGAGELATRLDRALGAVDLARVAGVGTVALLFGSALLRARLAAAGALGAPAGA